MTGIKVGLAAIGTVGGISSAVTGGIVANTPSLSNETPVSLTLGLVFLGIAATASAAWKVSRAWSKIENKIAVLETEVASLRKSRAAAFREKLEQMEREEK